MKLSAPIFVLKRRAKVLARQDNIPLHEALNRLANKEGYRSWSLLAATDATATPASRLFARLEPGDLVLLGARPGHGKTLMSLQLAVEAMKRGNPAVFFSLEWTEKDVLDRFHAIGEDVAPFAQLFSCDCSDAISAGYIIAKLSAALRGSLIVIDYLQVLDQKRDNPDLSIQIQTLKTFARERGVIVVFISQIDRSYGLSDKPCPDIADIRLPNPLDLKLFDKACFLNREIVRFPTIST